MECSSGKASYEYQHDAEDALGYVLRQPYRPEAPTRVYRCPECKHWHLTKAGPRKLRRRG